MADLALDTEPGTPHQRLFMPLEGVHYLFEFRWNERDAAWYMDILTEQEDPIASGLKVALGTYIGRQNRSDLMPPGDFFAADTEGTHREPGLDDLGARVIVYYREAT